MNLKLSYRDKVIFIVAMVIIVLVAGFFIFIKPKFEAVEIAKNNLTAKQQEKAEVDAKIDTLPDIITNMKDVANEVGEKQGIFLDEAHPYVNETYIMDIFKELNIQVNEMNTSYTTASAINRYTVSPKNILAYDNKMTADLYNELPQEVYDAYNGVAPPVYPNTVIGVTTVNIGFSSRNDFKEVYDAMDRIAKDEKTIILNTVGTEQSEDAEEQKDASITLTMYSIFPLNVEKVLEETDEIKPIGSDQTEQAAE